MARKDSEKDSERPHYYSQFWLDVAAGRRVIGAPKPEDEEAAEAEIAEPAPQRRSRVSEVVESNEQSEDIVQPVTETAADYIEPDIANESDTDDLSYQADTEEEGDFEVPDIDAVEEDEDYYGDEEEEDEEDDDLGWGRGRKKKPTRATKPVTKKPGKRDPRRGY